MVQRLIASLALLVLFSATAVGQRSGAPGSQPRNFIIILTDDQGYGDLGSYGHPTIRTPNLDRMAVEGQRWTSFYAAHRLHAASVAATDDRPLVDSAAAWPRLCCSGLDVAAFNRAGYHRRSAEVARRRSSSTAGPAPYGPLVEWSDARTPKVAVPLVVGQDNDEVPWLAAWRAATLTHCRGAEEKRRASDAINRRTMNLLLVLIVWLYQFLSSASRLRREQ